MIAVSFPNVQICMPLFALLLPGCSAAAVWLPGASWHKCCKLSGCLPSALLDRINNVSVRRGCLAVAEACWMLVTEMTLQQTQARINSRARTKA
jgi:hypothetical protein